MPRGMSWHDYNESLVERGRIIFDLGFADTWKSELKSMNKHKVGGPFDLISQTRTSSSWHSSRWDSIAYIGWWKAQSKLSQNTSCL
jgi:hypothetical protein